MPENREMGPLELEGAALDVPVSGQIGWVVWDDSGGNWVVDRVVVLEEGSNDQGVCNKSKVKKTGSGRQREWWVDDSMLFVSEQLALRWLQVVQRQEQLEDEPEQDSWEHEGL